MKNSLRIMVIMFLASVVISFTQPGIITGKVTDDNGNPVAGVLVILKGSSVSTVTGINGNYKITVSPAGGILVFSAPGYEQAEVKIGNAGIINVKLMTLPAEREELSAAGHKASTVSARESKKMFYTAAPAVADQVAFSNRSRYNPEFNTEGYAPVNENGYRDVKINPLSTFSIDVDNASYSNIRRFINLGEMPPADAVRIEEMINYFRYQYPRPEGEHPFSVYTEMAMCPWNRDHLIFQVGLRGKSIDKEELPPSNLVFLIDVSGSMNHPAKLPLLKSAFGLLVNELRAEDKVAIVVYAGAAGLVLEPTPGNRKEVIMKAIDNLDAGGSTAGGAGLRLAYATAEKNFVKGGNNRIILATDGDFNVGESSNGGMERLVEAEREKGIFITVLGFGMGNYKDDKMEIIADKGNGNYAYIDNLQEARRVLVREFGGTLFTIAKDVKFQIEFNPAKVVSYRLIGYENRILNEEDFNDDRKDAGEMGSGHTVTALYEIVPARTGEVRPLVDPLRYQRIESSARERGDSDEYLNIKIRYKKPDGLSSRLMEMPVKGSAGSIERASENLRFAASVAEFGMILRNSEFKGASTLGAAIDLAVSARGEDEDGYRAEFIRMMKTVRDLKLISERD